MDWIRENWFWIVVVGLFVWMHAKMHGSHGGHGGHGSHGGDGGHHGGCGHGGDSTDEAAHGAVQEEESHAQH